MEYHRIKELRVDNDLTQKEIAAFLEIPQRTYAGYESGTRSIPVQIVAALAKYYTTSADYLLNISGTKRIKKLINIMKLREKSGLTLTELQAETGINRVILFHYETGKQLPTTDHLMILSEYYQTSIDYLLDKI